MLDYRHYVTPIAAAFVGFIVRYFQERKKVLKVDPLYQFIISAGLSYLAWLVYVDRKITICCIEIWLWFWSYFASRTLPIFDRMFREIIPDALSSILQKFITIVGKKEKPNDHDHSK